MEGPAVHAICQSHAARSARTLSADFHFPLAPVAEQAARLYLTENETDKRKFASPSHKMLGDESIW